MLGNRVSLSLFASALLVCTAQSRWLAYPQPRTSLEFRYLPFGATTLAPVTTKDYGTLYDLTSLWRPDSNSIIALLSKARKKSHFAGNLVRLIVLRGGKVWLAVDSAGVVRSASGDLALSDAAFEDLKAWIFAHIPRPDVPKAVSSGCTPR